MVNDEVKNDPGIYPTPEVKAKLFPSLAYGEDFHAADEPHVDASSRPDSKSNV